MDPLCQYCGDENPDWELRERATGEPGPEICGTCLLMLRDEIEAMRWRHRMADRIGAQPSGGDDE